MADGDMGAALAPITTTTEITTYSAEHEAIRQFAENEKASTRARLPGLRGMVHRAWPLPAASAAGSRGVAYISTIATEGLSVSSIGRRLARGDEPGAEAMPAQFLWIASACTT